MSHSVNEEGEITLGWGLEQELPSGVGISTGYEVSEDLGGTPNQTAIGTGCAVKFAYEVSQEFKTMAGYTQTMGLYVEVPIVVPGTIEDRKRQENEAIQNWFRLNTITVYATKEEFDKAIEGLETKTQPPVQLDVSGLGDGSPESAAASMATDLAASGGPTTSLRPSVSIAANNIPNVSNKAHESVRLSALSIAGVVSVCVYLLL